MNKITIGLVGVLVVGLCLIGVGLYPYLSSLGSFRGYKRDFHPVLKDNTYNPGGGETYPLNVSYNPDEGLVRIQVGNVEKIAPGHTDIQKVAEAGNLFLLFTVNGNMPPDLDHSMLVFPIYYDKTDKEVRCYIGPGDLIYQLFERSNPAQFLGLRLELAAKTGTVPYKDLIWNTYSIYSAKTGPGMKSVIKDGPESIATPIFGAGLVLFSFLLFARHPIQQFMRTRPSKFANPSRIQAKRRGVPSFFYIGVGGFLFIIAVIGLAWNGISSVKWTWVNFVLAGVMAFAASIILAAVFRNGWFVLGGIGVCLLLLFGAAHSGMSSFLRYMMNPVTVERTGPERWRIEINFLAQDSKASSKNTRLVVPVGRKMRITGPASYSVTCQGTGWIMSDSKSEIILPSERCPGEIYINCLDCPVTGIFNAELLKE
jgi:hypothetical protein